MTHCGTLPGVAMEMKMNWILLMIMSLQCTSGFYIQPEIPVFSKSPGSLAVVEDGAITLVCAVLIQDGAGNLPQPQIQWLHNSTLVNEAVGEGVVISTTSNTSHVFSQLIVRSSSPKHAGFYQCLAEDGTNPACCTSNDPIPCVNSDTLSEGAWVHVLTRNGSRHEPIEVELFESTLLRCGSEFAETLHQSLPILWRRDGLPQTNTSSELILLNGDLMLYLDTNDTRDYECFVTIEMDLVLYRSYEVTVSSRRPGVQTDLLVSVSTTNSVVLPGNTLQLACSVAPSNSSFTGVSWTKIENSHEEAVGGGVAHLYGRVLNVGGVSTNDGGTYCCGVGGARSCVNVTIVTEVPSSGPIQIFIDFRSQVTHSINISCSISHSMHFIHWFRNGIQLENETEHLLTKSSDDPYQLYGVYQCSVGQWGKYKGTEIYTVARVLPYGITNPIEVIFYKQYLYPTPPLQPELIVPVLLWWNSPAYKGNLSSISYMVSTDSNTSYINETNIQLPFHKYFHSWVQIFVYDSSLGVLSTGRTKYIRATSDCDYYVFYPPTITNLSCSSGSVEVLYMFDEEANQPFDFSNLYQKPKEYYFFGGCRDGSGNLIYEVRYEKDDASPFSLQGGRSFKAGTWCTVRAANTPSPSLARLQCLNPRFLKYTEHSDCFVYASVGFETTDYVVEESTGHVQVCVRSEGYGFNLTLSASSSNPAVVSFENEVLVFEYSGVACVNVSVLDDDVLGPDETMVMTIATNNSYVVMENSTSVITVQDNDMVQILFQPDGMVHVLESAGSVDVCVKMEGRLRRRNATVSIHGSGPQNGDFVGIVTFAPGDQTSQCLSVSINDDDVVQDDRNWTFTLSSTDPAVMATQKSALVQILEDDSVVAEFDEPSYTVEEPDNLTACIRARGVLATNITMTISSLDGTARVGMDFLPISETFVLTPSSLHKSHCFTVVINSSSSRDKTPKTFTLILESPSKGVVLREAMVTVIYGNKESSTSTIILWSMVGVSVVAVAVIAIVLVLLLLGSRCFLSTLREKERVIEDNFRRRPLVEPFHKYPPDAWPDPITLTTTTPQITLEEDNCSDICNLDYKYPTVTTVASISTSASTVTPMTSNSTIGGVSFLGSRRTSSHNCSSSSTLDEYINPFLSPEQELKPRLDPTVQQRCISGKYSGDSSLMYLVPLQDQSNMDVTDSGIRSALSRELQSPESVEMQTTKISRFGTKHVDQDSRFGTKPVDQDSGCAIQETSGSSFNVDNPCFCGGSHSNSTSAEMCTDLDSGCHLHNTSIFGTDLGTRIKPCHFESSVL